MSVFEMTIISIINDSFLYPEVCNRHLDSASKCTRLRCRFCVCMCVSVCVYVLLLLYIYFNAGSKAGPNLVNLYRYHRNFVQK